MLETVAFYNYIDDKRMVSKMSDLDKDLSNGSKSRPIAIGGLLREELDAELKKGIESLKNGKAYTSDEVDAELFRKFGI